jgi:hypothetical protein
MGDDAGLVEDRSVRRLARSNIACRERHDQQVDCLRDQGNRYRRGVRRQALKHAGINVAPFAKVN